MPDSRKTTAIKSKTSMFQPFSAMKSTTMLRRTFSAAYSDELTKSLKLLLLMKIRLILNKAELSLNLDLEPALGTPVSNCYSNSKDLVSATFSTVSHVETICNKSHTKVGFTLTNSTI